MRFALIVVGIVITAVSGCGTPSSDPVNAASDALEAPQCTPTDAVTVCDDGNPCTDDACSTAGRCVHAPNTATCDDGNACTRDDRCLDAECVAGEAVTCDNGLFCDGVESCDAQAGCLDGTPPVLDDTVDCTVDACDEDADVVTHTPNDAACDNGLFCDGVESCDAQAGCLDGTPPVLDDTVDCTVDACDEDADVVTHTPNHAACSGGDMCNTASCDLVSGCVVQPVTDGVGCDPSDGCTTVGSCQAGSCVGQYAGVGADPVVIDYPLAAPVEAGTQHFRVAIVMVNTIGEIPLTSEPTLQGLKEYYCPVELGDVYFNHPDGVNAFINEASYGQVTLSGTVVGWLHQGDLGLSASDMQANRNAYFEQAADFIDFGTYDIFLLVGRAETGGMQIGWKLQNSINIAQGDFTNIGINFLINSSFLYPAANAYSQSLILPSSSWAHELLHTLGITGHSNSLWCGDATGNETLEDPCVQKGYGGVFSLMGELAYATHPDASMKLALGWLGPEHVTSADPTLSSTYDIAPLETFGTQPRVLTVPLSPPVQVAGLTLDRLVMEYRQPLGFDQYLTRLDGADAPDGGAFLGRYTSLPSAEREGVVLYLDSTADASDTTWLLDAHPTTDYNPNASIKHFGNPGKFADAILAVGETFNSTLLNFTVTPLGTNVEGLMQVAITPK